MKKYYNVTFKYAEDVYCANIAHAENKEDVEAHYSKYEWFKVSDATECDVENARLRGKPIVDVEPAKTPENATEAAKDTETETEPAETETTAESAKKAPAGKIDRATLASEFAKVWGDGTKMQKYCVGKVAAVAVLDDGTIITVDKQGIEKNFCFGESGYDYDEASDAAQHARTSENYFKSENMKRFNDALRNIEEAKTMNGRYILTYKKKAYSGQGDDCKLGYIEYKRTTEVLEDNGGSAVIAELPGKVMHERGGGAEYRIMTAADIEKVESAYRTAAEAHEKRVNTYLKKYGLANVHAWTYWRDA